MIFNSYTFVAFFIIILALHHLPISWKFKKFNLLIASYIFYAAWNPPFILLLWLSTVIDFFVGKALFTQVNPHKKKFLFVISLIGNLGMLCFFKYGTFLLDNFVTFVNLLGLEYHPATPSIILPAGISFYTFTTLCYTIDMYHKRSEPVKSMLDFSLFVTFFPHLVAGPIVRPPQLVPQFETERIASKKQMFDGLLLLSLGLFMKVVLADGMLSSTSDAVFNSNDALPALDAWIGVLAFSGQIFLDFAGYSTCAIGVALCLGFVLPQNFNYPYAAIGFSDFWRRWHITLSSWLKDYLYIPLGGNRHGKFRTYYALMLTMLLGGLWHGANWTFVAWGGLHGLYLWIEKYLSDRKKDNNTESNNTTKDSGWVGFFYALLTFILVNITWVFFRSDTFSKAWQMLISMSGTETDGKALLTTLAIIKVSIIVPAIIVTHWFMRNTKVLDVAHQLSWWKLGIAWSSIMLLLIWSQESGSSFIYFQF
ncbi:MBOAT family O-acyltransferase [Flavobacterium granuli]|uniref:D-alanyl-lipoteichoic acid acyltransferase DltB (MBOAT superfamily) n=1 Tax=Flavobacterium granuli TaxID=280093 RepID=A0ABU1S337_9FLAO|nr:MBOAT family O-acyltransferase [Flavobacterium granuli]MDR6844579.1 D-alanyl-lipoteichoic acid acyltransferase DltB (MBOAT superfamily) [Flavobacterium granuli]